MARTKQTNRLPSKKAIAKRALTRREYKRMMQKYVQDAIHEFTSKSIYQHLAQLILEKMYDESSSVSRRRKVIEEKAEIVCSEDYLEEIVLELALSEFPPLVALEKLI